MAEITIREAQEADARAMLDYLAVLTSEPGVPILLSHERASSFTVESERELIRRHRDQPNSLWLLAVEGERVVGMLNMDGGGRPESAHSVSLGVSVARDWRGRGVGRELMTRAIEWARRTEGISRVELEVFSDNARAIRLYERMGFATEGLRRRAYVKDGVAIDSLMMALLLP